MTQAHLTLKEAAEACGVSRSTIKRRQGDFANAYQDGTGTWRVPVSDLLGAGLKLRPNAPEDVLQGHNPARNGAYPAQNGTDLAQLLVCIEALNAGLATERTARQVAEARAAAYAANLDDLRFSLRAISGLANGLCAAQTAAPPRAQPSPVAGAGA